MNFELLRNSIMDINGLHKSISEEHFMQQNNWNLRKIQVKDVVFGNKISDDFLLHIEKYYEKLNFVIAYSDFDHEYRLWDGRIRLKQKESVQNKLFYYCKDHADGKVSLQKCLNDLLGFRLIIDDFNCETEEFKIFMESIEDEISLMRWYTRDKQGYVGTHVYFKNNNNLFFPWELQIWNKKHSETNEKSHAEHKAKRGYITWPKQYKEGILRKEDD